MSAFNSSVESALVVCAIFYLCYYIFPTTFLYNVLSPREYPNRRKHARMPRDSLWQMYREFDPVCASALMRACILIRENARMQLPTSLPLFHLICAHGRECTHNYR